MIKMLVYLLNSNEVNAVLKFVSIVSLMQKGYGKIKILGRRSDKKNDQEQ